MAAAPKAMATPACPDRYPSPAASRPRQRVPASKAAGLGRRTICFTSLDSAQAPVPLASRRPASSGSPASHAAPAVAGAAPRVPSCIIAQAGACKASGRLLTARNILASPGLTRSRRTARAVTSSVTAPTPRRTWGSASAPMSEPARLPVVSHGSAGAGDVAQARMPVSRIMNSPAPLAARTSRTRCLGCRPAAPLDFFPAYVASTVEPYSFETQPRGKCHASCRTGCAQPAGKGSARVADTGGRSSASTGTSRRGWLPWSGRRSRAHRFRRLRHDQTASCSRRPACGRTHLNTSPARGSTPVPEQLAAPRVHTGARASRDVPGAYCWVGGHPPPGHARTT